MGRGIFLSDEETESTPRAMRASSTGRYAQRDVLQDFHQASVDLYSYLSQASAHQQQDVTVPTNTLKILLDNVEIIRRAMTTQEKRSLASLYIGTILGALIGVVGNFFVSFWFQPTGSWNIVGLIVSLIFLLLICTALFLQAKKFAKERC